MEARRGEVEKAQEQATVGRSTTHSIFVWALYPKGGRLLLSLPVAPQPGTPSRKRRWRFGDEEEEGEEIHWTSDDEDSVVHTPPSTLPGRLRVSLICNSLPVG